MRILVIDPEYLVAMEAERILGLALPCEIQIAMPREFPEILESRNFDVVLIHAGLVRSAQAAESLRNAGIGVVLSTLLNDEAKGLADWPGVAVVQKPFDDNKLIDAIRNAARA